MSQALMIKLLGISLAQTLYMVLVSGAIATCIGIPLGIYLYLIKPNGLYPKPAVYKMLNFTVNMTRSIPYIILMIAIIPLTRLLVGTSIGTNASIVPLALSAIPFIARLVESAVEEVDPQLIKTLQAMGAKPLQIVYWGLLREGRSGIIQGITTTLIALVSYSAMAGAIGGGGLGSLAINYGYSRFQTDIMIATVVLLIILVQLIQHLGDFVVKKLRT